MSDLTVTPHSDAPLNDAADLYRQISAVLDTTVIGQSDIKREMIIALLSGGHILMEGVPGIAKTLLAKTLAKALSCEFKRIQFTPDLMPSDVIGTNVFDPKSNQFNVKRGPIFTPIALIDEINRAPAKTQSALLEVMEERQITIDGTRYLLPEPFMVMATQNPIEYEGTYPLPEAQLDRFMFKLIVPYPSASEEEQVLRAYHGGFDAHQIDQIKIENPCTPEMIARARHLIRQIVVDDGILKYITEVVRKTRETSGIMVGASPRATINLLLAAKTQAALANRTFVIPDDVKDLAPAVLRHRLVLQPETEMEGLRPDDMIRDVLNTVPVPR